MEQYKIQSAIEDAGHELGAIYHSHTRTPPFPSQTDINLAFYPEALYVIVGVAGDEPDVRAFRIVEGEVSEQAARGGRMSEALICASCATPHAAERALLPRLRHAARAFPGGRRGGARR